MIHGKDFKTEKISKLMEEIAEEELTDCPMYLVEIGKKGYGVMNDEDVYEFDNEEDAKSHYEELKNTIKPNQYVTLSKKMEMSGDCAYEEILNSEEEEWLKEDVNTLCDKVDAVTTDVQNMIKTVKNEEKINEYLTPEEIKAAREKLEKNIFIPTAQKERVSEYLMGEEGSHFVEIIDRLQKIVDEAPNMYETDGQKDKKPVLHYFYGSYDSYAYELDKKTGEMFSHVNLGYGYELGYTSMDEINSVPYIELDFYYDGEKPRGLDESVSNLNDVVNSALNEKPDRKVIKMDKLMVEDLATLEKKVDNMDKEVKTMITNLKDTKNEAKTAADIETLTLDNLIGLLQNAKKEIPGDTKVFLSSDPEGNSFGTLDNKWSFGYDKNTNYGAALVISPYAEGIDLYDY